MKEFWTSLASLLGVLAFCQSLLQVVFPPELRFATVKLVNRMCHLFSSYCYFDITEIDGVNTNELYNAVQLYLSSSVSITGSRLSLTRAPNSSAITFGLSNNDSINDTFNGASVLWEHVVTQRQSQTFSWQPLPEEKRGFTLRIRKRDKSLVLDSYMDYIMEKASDIRRKNQDRLLYTNSRGGSLDSRGHPWESVPFKHPSTFDTLAMDPKKKQGIMDDLKDFANSQGFYQKTGRAWKRGYLLFGPPGTGKSSMIAAMANYLNYDIYDLELTTVKDNTELRRLLIETTSKSIIVIEDIDCSLDLTGQRKKKKEQEKDEEKKDPASKMAKGEEESSSKVTLSGLLNFIDGLWSACGGERIIVFTTNYVEKLDPALIRRGRMDMHIEMSYCGFEAFKVLAKNYLDVDSHELFATIDHLLKETDMTPADVAENLMPKSQNEDAETCLKKLMKAIKMAKEDAKKKAEEEARLKAEKEEKEKQEATQEDVKVDESLAKDVKENGVDVVKDDKTLGKEVKENGVTA